MAWQRTWVHRTVSEDGRAIAEVIQQVDISNDAHVNVSRSASVQVSSDGKSSYASSQASVQVVRGKDHPASPHI